MTAPPDEWGRHQLGQLVRIGRDDGFEIGWFDIRRRRSVAALWQLLALVRGAGELVVGDPASGLFQFLMVFARAREVVIIDDGSSTRESTDLIAKGGPLVRWPTAGRGQAPWPRRVLGGRTTRWLTPGPARAVSLFTVMPAVEVPGMAVEANGYAWLRTRMPDPSVTERTDLVGSSLVETGLVDEDVYLDLVRLAASEGEVGRYFAHRREGESKLARIASETGLDIVRPELPLEMILGEGPVPRRVVTFPSSVAFTLPVVLSGLDVAVEVISLDGRFASSASDAAVRLIGSLPHLAAEGNGPVHFTPSG